MRTDRDNKMSKNISDLRDAREAAGQRYLAASKEFYEAHIDLVALDAAMATLVGEPELFRIEATPCGSTGFSWVDPVEASSRYADPYRPTNWHADIQARRNAYLKGQSQ
jgi:hypothetical protein